MNHNHWGLLQSIGANYLANYVTDTTRTALTSFRMPRGSNRYTRPRPYPKRIATMQRVAAASNKGTHLGYQIGRSLNRTPPTELKAFDVALTNTNFAAAGNFQLLNAPITGSELFNRIGRKIYMKSIEVRAFIQNVSTSVQDTGRVILIYDSQPNNAGFVNTDILADSTALGATSGYSGINLANRQRFKIIRDYQVMLPSVTNTAGVLTNGPAAMDTVWHGHEFHWFVPLKGLETVYNGNNAGTVADINSGALVLMFISNGAGNTWTCSHTTRLRYYD